MNSQAKDWKQAGHLYAWHYPRERQRHASGWHVTADDAGCTSFVDLLDRLQSAGTTQYRTLKLGTVTDEITTVPAFGRALRNGPDTCRVKYDPEFADLAINLDGTRLIVRLGAARVGDLRAGFVEISVGGGDYAIHPTDRTLGEPLWFWWMHGPPIRRLFQ